MTLEEVRLYILRMSVACTSFLAVVIFYFILFYFVLESDISTVLSCSFKTSRSNCFFCKCRFLVTSPISLIYLETATISSLLVFRKHRCLMLKLPFLRFWERSTGANFILLGRDAFFQVNCSRSADCNYLCVHWRSHDPCLEVLVNYWLFVCQCKTVHHS